MTSPGVTHGSGQQALRKRVVELKTEVADAHHENQGLREKLRLLEQLNKALLDRNKILQAKLRNQEQP